MGGAHLRAAMGGELLRLARPAVATARRAAPDPTGPRLSRASRRFGRRAERAAASAGGRSGRSVRAAATTPHRREMVRRLGDAGDEGARRSHRQRWEAETVVVSTAERRRGEALSARLDGTRHAQALLRGAVCNLNRPVRLDYAGRAFRQGTDLQYR